VAIWHGFAKESEPWAVSSSKLVPCGISPDNYATAAWNLVVARGNALRRSTTGSPRDYKMRARAARTETLGRPCLLRPKAVTRNRANVSHDRRQRAWHCLVFARRRPSIVRALGVGRSFKDFSGLPQGFAGPTMKGMQPPRARRDDMGLGVMGAAAPSYAANNGSLASPAFPADGVVRLGLGASDQSYSAYYPSNPGTAPTARRRV
jgi:hypothetical protein